MKIAKTGIIIKTKLKKECISFYRDVLNLTILFENEFLTCFSLHEIYLMIEPLAEGIESHSNENLVIRINVENVLEEKASLDKRGVSSYYNKYEWGEILTFFDPAGIKFELKDSGKFENQIQEYKSAKYDV